MGWFRKRHTGEAPGRSPRRRRWQIRLIFFLALPVAVSITHLSLVAWRGEPFSTYDCRSCGARLRVVSQRLFGCWPVGNTTRLEETPCSRLLREHCGWKCPGHEWVFDGGSRRLARLGFEEVRWLDAGPGDTEHGPLARQFLIETTPETWRTLGLAADRSPEEVRDLVRFMLGPRDFGGLWYALRAALSHAVDQRSSDGERLELRQLLPSNLDAETWAAIRSLVVVPATTTSTGPVAPAREVAFTLLAWMMEHGSCEERWQLPDLLGLCGRGPDVVELLARLLEDPSRRSMAYGFLWRVGVEVEGVEEALGRAADCKDLRYQIADDIAARRIMPRNPAVVQALMRALDDEEKHPTLFLHAIAQLGEPARDTVQAMLPQVLEDRRWWPLRVVDGWPILRIRSVRSFILACVGAPDAPTRRLACSMLPMLGPTDAEIKASLDQALGDADRLVRGLARAAAKILVAPERPHSDAEWIEAYDNDAAKREIAARAGAELQERLRAIESHWRSKPGPLSAPDDNELALMIHDPAPSIAWAALELVAQFGADARNVLKHVRARAADSVPEVRDAAEEALEAIERAR